MNLSDWTEQNIKLPTNTSLSGRWSRETAPYQAPILDAISDIKVRRIAVMSGSQIGKTLIQQCAVGYYMKERPRPILFIQPNIGLCKEFVKNKMRPFIEGNEGLLALTGTLRGTQTENSLTHIQFPSGFLKMAGTQASGDLAMNSVGLLLMDECDRYALDVDGEGDPMLLARQRGNSYWDFKEVNTSTPTDATTSRIKAEYLLGSQELWMTPCPSCGESSVFEFDRFDCDTYQMACPACGSFHDEYDWKAMGGEFVAQNPEVTDIRSFHVPGFLSPFISWKDISVTFHEAMTRGIQGQKTFQNTTLGLPWSDVGESVEPEGLMKRLEVYTADVPKGVLILTAGVDVQKDRLEYEVIGWGMGYESWSVDWGVIYGNPLHQETWQALDEILTKRYTHDSGLKMTIARAFIDSGFLPRAVYDFVAKKGASSGVSASKGRGGSYPLVEKPQQKKRSDREQRTVPLYMIGVDEAKMHVYSYLTMDEVGAGYCHFKDGMNNENYFAQLTAEKRVKKDTKAGIRYEWVNQGGKRNEALDLRVYALAACHNLDPNWHRIARKLESKINRISQEKREIQESIAGISDDAGKEEYRNVLKKLEEMTAENSKENLRKMPKKEEVILDKVEIKKKKRSRRLTYGGR
jgi:phage terminase large subunit GpA-like protein